MGPSQWVTGVFKDILIELFIFRFGNFTFTSEPQGFIFVHSLVFVIPSLFCCGSVD